MNPADQFQCSRRGILIENRVPDWDPQFLAKYDLESALEAIQATGAGAVMMYLQPHTGLCNWQNVSAQQHKTFQGHDHPDWRLIPAGSGMMGGGCW